MAENKMKQIAEILEIELNVPFNVVGSEYNPHILTEKGFFDRLGRINIFLLESIAKGLKEIEKLPFKPKRGDDYWMYEYHDKLVYKCTHLESSIDFALIKIGNCFRTEKEARTKGKKLMESIVMEYEDDC